MSVDRVPNLAGHSDILRSILFSHFDHISAYIRETYSTLFRYINHVQQSLFESTEQMLLDRMNFLLSGTTRCKIALLLYSSEITRNLNRAKWIYHTRFNLLDSFMWKWLGNILSFLCNKLQKSKLFFYALRLTLGTLYKNWLNSIFDMCNLHFLLSKNYNSSLYFEFRYFRCWEVLASVQDLNTLSRKKLNRRILLM